MKKSWLWLTIAGFAAVVLISVIVGLIGCTSNIETNIENVNLPGGGTPTTLPPPLPPGEGEGRDGASDEFPVTPTTLPPPVAPIGGEEGERAEEFPDTTSTTTTPTTSTTSATLPDVGDITITPLGDAGTGGEDIDIAVDLTNKPHISYYNNVDHDLAYTTNASGSWVTTTVDSLGDTGA